MVAALALKMAARAAADENARWKANSIGVDIALIGNRPAGSVPLDSLMIQASALAIEAVGFPKVIFGQGSSDANLPVSLGLPAVPLGSGGRNGGTHSFGEWYQPQRAYVSPQASFLATLGLVGIEGASRPLLPQCPHAISAKVSAP